MPHRNTLCEVNVTASLVLSHPCRRIATQELCRDKAWYLLFAHARVAVEFHRRQRLSTVLLLICSKRDEYSSVFLANVRDQLSCLQSTLHDCIVSSFLEGSSTIAMNVTLQLLVVHVSIGAHVTRLSTIVWASLFESTRADDILFINYLGVAVQV